MTSDLRNVLPHVQAAVRAGVDVPAEQVAPLLAELERRGTHDEPAPVDWPARFRAAADAADDRTLYARLAWVDAALERQPPQVVEAIGRKLSGEEAR